MNHFLMALFGQLTCVVIVVILALVFWKPITAKLGRISRVTGEGKRWEIFWELQEGKAQQALPDAGGTVITPDDVLEAFRAIPDLNEADIRKHLGDAHMWLLRHGVVTRRQLKALTSSTTVLSTLRSLYIQELSRPQNAPLDPVAIATWGAFLFTYGLSGDSLRQDVVAAVRNGLRRSPERKLKQQ